MNIQQRPAIVVLGMMTTVPVGGVIWQTIHYLIGLQRLGFDVYYAEDHGMHPKMFSDAQDPSGATKAVAFLAKTMERFDLGLRWSYHSWESAGQYYGLGKAEIDNVYKKAAAVINLHGATSPRPEYQVGGAFIYLETDPVAPQIELHQKVTATEQFLDAHTACFTFGENIGAADCKVPTRPERYNFQPTRQPVLLDFWQANQTDNGGASQSFTTIANWRQPERQMTFEGEVFHWSKHYEFLKFLELPERTAQRFELALSSYEVADREMLESHGWDVRPALEFSRDADSYRSYIMQSRGEWTVAKDQNVRLRSGWFSDRAATYLAAGRPVVTQETGFSNVLPVGSGLFAFTNMEEAVGAISAINRQYAQHSQAAAEIAREYFSYKVVLPKLLRGAGVSLPPRG